MRISHYIFLKYNRLILHILLKTGDKKKLGMHCALSITNLSLVYKQGFEFEGETKKDEKSSGCWMRVVHGQGIWLPGRMAVLESCLIR